MKWCLDLIKRLEPISGLKLKFTKMSAYAPNKVGATMCEKFLPREVEIHEDKEMNVVYL